MARAGSRVASRTRDADHGGGRQYLTSLTLQGGGAALGLGVQIGMASWLGASGYGELSAILAVTTILSLVGTLGTNGAALRFIPHFQASNDHANAAKFAAFTVTTTLLASGVLAAAFLVTSLCAGSHLTIAGATAGAVLVVVSALQTAAIDLGRLAGQLVRAYGSVLIIRQAAIAAATLIAIGFGVHRSVTAAIAIMVCGAALGLVIQLDAIRYGLGSSAVRLIRPVKPWLRASPPYIVIITLQLILSQIDLLAVTAYLPTTAVGYYAAALRISAVLTLPYVAIMAVITPRISSLASGDGGGTSQALRVMIHATAWCGAATTLIALPMLAEPQLVLRAFGSSFGAGDDALRALAIGQIVISSLGPGATLLVYMDRRRVAIAGFGGCLVASGLACALGAQLDGINGAAIASGASLALVGIVMYALSWRYLGLHISMAEVVVPKLRPRRPGATSLMRATPSAQGREASG